MIIIGYPGIGKSSIAGRKKFIDLESGNFWNEGKRADDWYVTYCKIAVHLSQQGFDVLTCSHQQVMEHLRTIPHNEDIIVVGPTEDLKPYWRTKLEYRYARTQLDKDYKAWMAAEKYYDEHIKELMTCGFPFYPIKDMKYNLKDIIASAKLEMKLKKRYGASE